jgi:hypothetical protein
LAALYKKNSIYINFNKVNFFLFLTQTNIFLNRAKKSLPGVPVIVKEAISLARLKLNPMAEILNLWSENLQENGVLHIPMHYLQVNFEF